MTYAIDLADFFPAFTVQRKMLIDLDIGKFPIYWEIVTVEYYPTDLDTPIAIYNSKGRKLPRILAKIIAENKLQYLQAIN